MKYFETSQEWLEQTLLLIEASPTTTRLTTRYSVKPRKPRRVKKQPQTESTTGEASTGEATTTTTTTSSTEPQSQPKDTSASTTAPKAQAPAYGSLDIKTYDPVSGVVLKYRTYKLAEVSRLIGIAHARIAYAMAGLPPPDELMPDAPAAPPTDAAAAAASTAATGAGADAGASQAQAQAQPQATTSTTKTTTQQQQQQQQKPGGTAKRKKKGRK